ncbi:MAG: sulfotransferase family protein [Pirellulaceae bacterium]
MSWNQAIWIAGVARSGTSWIGQILNSHPQVRFRFQPLFAYEFKGRVDEDSTQDEYLDFLNQLWSTETEFLTQADKVRSGEYPRFQKSQSPTALVFKENRYQSVIEPFLRRVPQARLVAVVRHPCAVINSWRKNSSEFPAGSVLRDEWRFGNCKNSGPQDYFGYYKWKEVTNLYLDLARQYPDRVFVLQFERLVHNRMETGEQMLKFAGLDLDQQTLDFLNASGDSHQDSYYSVFKNSNVTSKWKQELDSYVVSEIHDDLQHTRLQQFLEIPE